MHACIDVDDILSTNGDVIYGGWHLILGLKHV